MWENDYTGLKSPKTSVSNGSLLKIQVIISIVTLDNLKIYDVHKYLCLPQDHPMNKQLLEENLRFLAKKYELRNLTISSPFPSKSTA